MRSRTLASVRIQAGIRIRNRMKRPSISTRRGDTGKPKILCASKTRDAWIVRGRLRNDCCMNPLSTTMMRPTKLSTVSKNRGYAVLATSHNIQFYDDDVDIGEMEGPSRLQVIERITLSDGRNKSSMRWNIRKLNGNHVALTRTLKRLQIRPEQEAFLSWTLNDR
jgi:hypothetical protein